MMTKVNLPMDRMIDMSLEIYDLLGFYTDTVLHTLVRSRTDITSMLDAVLREVMTPYKLLSDDGKMLCSKVMYSCFEPPRGEICLIQVILGTMQDNDRVYNIYLLEIWKR